MTNKIFIDTEFIEAGPSHPIRLISIGMVDEQGNEYYAIDANCDYSKVSPWVIENVLPHLDMSYAKDRNTIRREIYDFVNMTLGYKDDDVKAYSKRPEFWSYYADYDWVIFAQIFGTMVKIPSNFPHFCMDIKQYAEFLGNPTLPESKEVLHNALSDARWHKQMYDYLVKYEKEMIGT